MTTALISDHTLAGEVKACLDRPLLAQVRRLPCFPTITDGYPDQAPNLTILFSGATTTDVIADVAHRAGLNCSSNYTTSLLWCQPTGWRLIQC